MRPAKALRHLLLALAGVLTLAGCGQQPPEGFDEPPTPALWEVTGADGQQGWLFGTIHALPGGVEWRTELLDEALASSDVLVLEVSNLASETDRAALFARLSAADEMPLLTDRVDAAHRDALAELLEDGGYSSGHFHRTDTWAAALTVAQIGSNTDSSNGVDRALQAGYSGAIEELEGAEAQLRLFDNLPEADQRDLLSGVVDEAAHKRDDPLALARIWYSGDMSVLASLESQSLLSDPELKEALLTSRNLAWAAKISAMLDGGRKPMIAVGAMHMPGDGGLVGLLWERGYQVRRIQ